MELMLPANATPIETAVATVGAERRPIDHGIITRSKNPWTTPEHLLPYLAFEMSVDLWDETWPAAKKRAVIARSIRLAAIKGTEAGISEAVEIMGGKVLSVIAPPATLFLSVTRTEQQKAEWLARMPQLRVYPKRENALVRGFHVGMALPQFIRQSEAFYHSTPRVTIWRNGVETDLLVLERRRQDPTISETEEFIQAREKGPMSGFFIGRALPSVLHISKAKALVYTVRTRTSVTIPGQEELSAEFAGPSLEPIDVRPQAVRQSMPLLGLWSGGGLLGAGVSKHLFNSRARLAVYKRIYLYDPDVPASAHSGRTFIGRNFRFGQPAYTAELKIEIKQQRPPAAFLPFVYGYLIKPNHSKKRGVIEAILSHKSLRDRILVNTNTRGTVTAGPGVTAGEDLVAGQIVAI